MLPREALLSHESVPVLREAVSLPPNSLLLDLPRESLLLAANDAVVSLNSRSPLLKSLLLPLSRYALSLLLSLSRYALSLLLSLTGHSLLLPANDAVVTLCALPLSCHALAPLALLPNLPPLDLTPLDLLALLLGATVHALDDFLPLPYLRLSFLLWRARRCDGPEQGHRAYDGHRHEAS